MGSDRLGSRESILLSIRHVNLSEYDLAHTNVRMTWRISAAYDLALRRGRKLIRINWSEPFLVGFSQASSTRKTGCSPVLSTLYVPRCFSYRCNCMGADFAFDGMACVTVWRV